MSSTIAEYVNMVFERDWASQYARNITEPLLHM